MLGWKDVNGTTASEYYSQRSHHLPEDSRLILQVALEGWLVGSISSWRGLESWKADMSNRVNAILAEDEVKQRQSLLREASTVLSRYERMEATTMLELALWKMETKSADLASAESAARTAIDRGDREACRVRSGASFIIPNAIAFLYETNLT